jgi:choline dehydrogenase
MWLGSAIPQMKYDVAIVGGGTAGCILGARLSEDPARSVLVLEAGPDYSNLESFPNVLKDPSGNAVHTSQYNWKYEGSLTHDHGRVTRVVRGRVVGGSSSVNGSLFLRGVPEDYDAWGSALWTFASVLPFFCKLENDLDFTNQWHGASGPIPVQRPRRENWSPFHRSFVDAALHAGFPEWADLNHPDGFGVGALPKNNPAGVRMNTALAYLTPVRTRPNLAVIGDAVVTRILFTGRRATGLAVAHRGQTVDIEASEIVLSAGAIESPHVLILSGIGPVGTLERLGIPVVQGLPGVGQNLKDHPFVGMEFRPQDGHCLGANDPRTQTCLFYTAGGSRTRNDLQLLLHVGSTPGHQSMMGVQLVCSLGLSSSVGALDVLSSDPQVGPLLAFRYLEDAHDRERFREALEVGLDLSASRSLRRVLAELLSPGPSDFKSRPALDGWLLHNVQTNSHTCGTCKMGDTADSMAVVDEYCNVYGVEGLRVADLSIAPNVPRANTNATAMMIGERVADLMIKRGAQRPESCAGQG